MTQMNHPDIPCRNPCVSGLVVRLQIHILRVSELHRSRYQSNHMFTSLHMYMHNSCITHVLGDAKYIRQDCNRGCTLTVTSWIPWNTLELWIRWNSVKVSVGISKRLVKGHNHPALEYQLTQKVDKEGVP